MAITTYAELLTAIQTYEDDTSTVVTGIQADMVTLAEARIYQGHGAPGDPMYCPPLRCRAMEKNLVIPINAASDGGTSTGSANAHVATTTVAPTLIRGNMVKFIAGYSNTGATTLNVTATGVVAVKKGRSLDALEDGDIVVGGTYTVYHDGTYWVLMPSDGACPVPARFLGAKSAYLQDRDRFLTQMPASGMNIWLENSTADTPDYFAVTGDAIRFDPLPSGAFKLGLEYYAKPSALSTALNDIFRESPGIYLFASLLELAIYLPNAEGMQRHYNSYMGALRGYMASDKATSTGTGPMRVRLGIAP